MGDREKILNRIRLSFDKNGSRGQQESTFFISRDYNKTSVEQKQHVTAKFAERVGQYKANVHIVSRSELISTIETVLQIHKVKTIVVPGAIPKAWISRDKYIVSDDDQKHLGVEELDNIDAVLTGCTAAIAQTGTIILNGRFQQGRRVISLIPDLHICIVDKDQIFDLVPEAITVIAKYANDPLTFISGPSATSDIELKRVEGVHGPRNLEVIIID